MQLARVLGPSPVIKLQLPPAAALVKLPQLQLPAGLQGKGQGEEFQLVCMYKKKKLPAPLPVEGRDKGSLSVQQNEITNERLRVKKLTQRL